MDGEENVGEKENKKVKKILLISFEYPVGKTYCGGVGQIVKQSRNALLDLGCQVYVLISSEFHKKYPIKLLLPDNSILHYSNFQTFQREYDLFKFNYIIQHFVNWTRKLEKIKNHKGKRPKIVYHFHSILRRERDAGFKTLNRFLLNQEKMIQIADKIICPSRYEYDNFIRYFPFFLNKVVLIENTIETFPLQMQKVKNIITKYGIKKEDIVSIYVGRFERIKGAEVIIKFIPRVLKKHKNLKFFMIGKVLERDLYKRLMASKKIFPHQIFYIRYLEKNELFQYYYLSHIYINTSLSESFSLTTHESALCNNALLLNKLPVFDKFKDAALFLNHDANNNDFISNFEYLIKNRWLRDLLSKKANGIAKDFLAKNRLREELSKFFSIC